MGQPNHKRREKNHLGYWLGGGIPNSVKSLAEQQASAGSADGRKARCLGAAKLLIENPDKVEEYLAETDGDPVPEEWQEKYENEASRYWDLFYLQKGKEFFKMRHYLKRELPEIAEVTEKASVVEIGCGHGSNLFPMLELNSNLYAYAYDFSAQAVEQVKANENFDPTRCQAHVRDITSQPLTEVIEGGLADFVMVFFVLSAIHPTKYVEALRNLKQCLKPGGILLFRDYGLHDLAQLRFAPGHKLEENFYVRGDGTRSYFFREDKVREIFSEAGFDVLEVENVKKEVTNRKREVTMARVWIQGKFCIAGTGGKITKKIDAPVPSQEDEGEACHEDKKRKVSSEH